MTFQPRVLALSVATPVSAMFFKNGNITVNGKTFSTAELDKTARAGTQFNFESPTEKKHASVWSEQLYGPKMVFQDGNVRARGKEFSVADLDKTARAGTSFKFDKKESTEQKYTSHLNSKKYSVSQLDKAARAGQPFKFDKKENTSSSAPVSTQNSEFSMPSFSMFNVFSTANCANEAPKPFNVPTYTSSVNGQDYSFSELDRVARAGTPFKFPKN